MAQEGIIRMSAKEVKRVGILQRVIGKELTQVKAAGVLGISGRHIRRLVIRLQEEGEKGLVHRFRGRAGNYRIKEKDEILELYGRKYPDFGPTFASEKLWELDKLKVNRETLRLWLLEKKDDYEWRRKSRPHKKWRPRKECFGEMTQIDGSHHDWLEGRGPKLVLMCYVDDAMGRVFARFYMYEGVKPALDSMYGYIEEHGIPQSIYLDKHSTYKTTRIQSIFEQLMDEEALTQFERAMEELGIEVIHAHSAPAKGRVENRFKTFQDRLVKEMRLKGIRTLAEANKFLDGYLPKFNKRFSVPAKSEVNLHRKRPSRYVLDATLCIKEERSLRKNSTVHYKKKIYLVTNKISNRVSRIIVEERLDGSIRIKHKNNYLKYKDIDPKMRIPGVEKMQDEILVTKVAKKKKSSKPSKDHPWRHKPPFRYIDPKKYLVHLNEYALLNK